MRFGRSSTSREDGKQNKRAVAEKLVEMARNGNIEAMKLVFERVDGKVPRHGFCRARKTRRRSGT